jgi:hypothetical protein
MVQVELKRYNLAIPEPLFDELQERANNEHTSMLEFLRKLIRLGLTVYKLSETPGAEIIVRQGDRERQLIVT